jgi:outer membrane receptor protein involved in Fe transport
LFNINGRFVTMPINEGEALSRGIELEAKFPLRVFIPTAPAIDLRFNVARNFSRVSTIPGPDNRLDEQTPVSGNVGIDYRMADFPITLGGNFGFQNGGNLRISATETRFSSVKRTLDMFGLWKVNKQSQLRLALSDLLHQDVLEGSAFSDATGSLSQSSVSENDTSVRLTFETKF